MNILSQTAELAPVTWLFGSPQLSSTQVNPHVSTRARLERLGKPGSSKRGPVGLSTPNCWSPGVPFVDLQVRSLQQQLHTTDTASVDARHQAQLASIRLVYMEEELREHQEQVCVLKPWCVFVCVYLLPSNDC